MPVKLLIMNNLHSNSSFWAALYTLSEADAAPQKARTHYPSGFLATGHYPENADKAYADDACNATMLAKRRQK